MAGLVSKLNGRKGGRPKGKKSKSTLQKEAVLAAFRQRTMSIANLLLDSQLTLARGQTFLYRIDKEWVPTGKGKGYYKSLKPELVESQWEIEAYLEKRIEEGELDDDKDSGSAYYYLTTKEPDNRAIDSLLDRSFGKSVSNVEIAGKDGQPLQIAIAKEVADKQKL